VNPVTDQHIDVVKHIFHDRAKWVDVSKDGTDGYGSEYAVFNEYMTWAMFSLYCMDNYAEADYQQMLPRMETQMESSRGFIRFGAFNRQLMRLHKANRKATVEDLYEQILSWCEHNAE
jgi:hypothetical protein